ncbi:MAG TPA: hypothetical protein VGC22_07890 [Chitinophaga sp.]
MKFLPCDHFTLQTRFPPEKVQEKLLLNLTAPPSGVRLEFLPAYYRRPVHRASYRPPVYHGQDH